ncbi:putative GPH family sugar transporter [Oceanicola granulosus HTCC2516]|uniref:Putative GPH family sugar transporter n=1 Tax=Oceanicola granulosus (strain ATCC BAA-861 / DSM 15982 / KCTC 12143 / HTCC2516) TaxID=314256 RepID=Q2CII2_OCEGH|nr:MFS transporter [Oceanicola granulosus]EAR52607.1 putative GPH family sugar transporter [Oceanicola granulosus HTCC2516]
MALSFGQKAGWGLADMGIGVFVVVKQLLVFAFLTTFLGVPPAVAGWATFLVLGFDVVTDPLVGYLSDRTESRWGRRLPWMAVGAPILAGGVVGMFLVPEGMGWQANMGWVVAFFALATIGFTCVAIPYGAMAGEMTQEARERSAMTAWRMVFASLGLLAAGAVVPALAGESRSGYGRAVLTVAPLILVTIWGMLWLTRAAPRISRPATGSFAATLARVMGNRPFATLVSLYGLMTLAVAIVAAGLQLAALYLIADAHSGPIGALVDTLGAFSTLFACFIVGAVASQYPWVRLSARLGQLGALIAGLALYIVVLGIIYLALPAASVSLLAVLFVLAGVGNGAYQQIPWAMYPDLMDLTRSRTGEPIEGAFSALWLFGQKVANACAPLILGLILAAAGWQESTSGVVPQSDAALEALRVSLTLVPAALLALALLGCATLYRGALRRAVA